MWYKALWCLSSVHICTHFLFRSTLDLSSRGEPERACTAVLSWHTNHGWQQDLSSLVPRPLPDFISKQNFVQPFLGPRKLLWLYIHAWTKLYNEVISWISGAYEPVIMHGPYLKRTQLLYVIWQYRLWAACPCLSWSAVATISEELYR